MKKILAFSLAAILFTTCFSQRRNYEARTYDYYMIKSQHLKTAGWILLGAGAGMFVGGVILFTQGTNEVNNNNNNYYYDNNSANSKITGGALLITGGVLCSVGSIPLLVIGGIMHKKAMRASAFLDMERVPNSKWTGISLQPFPALGMRINL